MFALVIGANEVQTEFGCFALTLLNCEGFSLVAFFYNYHLLFSFFTNFLPAISLTLPPVGYMLYS